MTCAKDKSFKIWQFPLVWVDEQDVDLQRVPDSVPTRKAPSTKKPASGATSASAAASSMTGNHDYSSDDSDDDDGLGKIKKKRADSSDEERKLPAGLGQMFNMSNPLAAMKPAAPKT